MYENCKVNGPYINREERSFVIILFPDGKSKTTQYCRYLMEKELDRELLKNEEVHHKDHNHSNNNMDNLEIIESSEHRRLHRLKQVPIKEVVCFECGEKFYLDKKQQRKRKNLAICFCSRVCSGKYGAKIQNSYDRRKDTTNKRNTSGYRGVKKSKNRWKAEIYYNGKKHCLGSFSTPEEASERYKQEVELLREQKVLDKDL